MSIKFLIFSGGGVFWVWGGGECRFYFHGRADSSEKFQPKFSEHFFKIGVVTARQSNSASVIWF